MLNSNKAIMATPRAAIQTAATQARHHQHRTSPVALAARALLPTALAAQVLLLMAPAIQVLLLMALAARALLPTALAAQVLLLMALAARALLHMARPPTLRLIKPIRANHTAGDNTIHTNNTKEMAVTGINHIPHLNMAATTHQCLAV